MNQNIHPAVHGLGTSPARVFDLHQPLRPIREGTHMSCDVIFGSPSSDCRGTGVCKISAHQPGQGWARRHHDCQSTIGICTGLGDGRQLSIVFFRELLCVNILRKHLMRDVLELREPCPLPAELVKFLHLKIKILPPGQYPIEEGQGYYRVTFRSHNYHKK